MNGVKECLRLLSENWFLQEPAFFALYCQQQLQENARMECAVRCGQGRIEYNPLLLKHKNYHEVEQLMRIEMIRLYLKHPYERQPEGCCREAMSIGSDITIADGYCQLHEEKLPLREPGFYHLPLGQYYEWYAKAIQNQQNDENEPRNNAGSSSSQQNRPSNTPSSAPENIDEKSNSDKDKSGLWQEDSQERQKINELIARTQDWGTLPGEVVERIKASTRARIDNRLIWQGFKSAILSQQRHLTRMRPNRRTGFLQMGSTRQFDTHLLIAIDTSGSITTDTLTDFYSSVNRLFRYGMAQIDVCQFDAVMHDIVPMEHACLEITVSGRGGTNFQPLFDYIEVSHHDYDGLLVLTDGMAPEPVVKANRNTGSKPKPKIPVLWVCKDRAAYEMHHEWMKKTGRCCYL